MARPLNVKFVADGPNNLLRSPEFQSRPRELHDAVRARHAAALAHAGFLQRLMPRRSIAMEFRTERRRLEPSLHVLY